MNSIMILIICLLFIATVDCATITSISPSQSRSVGGVPITVTGTGFVGGSYCYWGSAGSYFASSPAWLCSPSTLLCLTPSYSSVSLSTTLYVGSGGSNSNTVPFTYSSSAALPTYSGVMLLTVTASSYLVAVGQSVSVNLTLQTGLPCVATTFSLSHPYGTFNVASVTFSVGQVLKTVSLTINSPGDAVPTITALLDPYPFSFKTVGRAITSYQKFTFLNTTTRSISQGNTVTVNLILSPPAFTAALTFIPSGSFLFVPATITVPANKLSATFTATATTYGEQSITVTPPALGGYASSTLAFSVTQKMMTLELASSTLVVGNSISLKVLLSKPTSKAMSLSILCSYCFPSSTAPAVAIGATFVSLTLRPNSFGYFQREILTVTSSTNEYAPASISLRYVPKTINVSGIPTGPISVGTSFTATLTCSLAPSSTLSLDTTGSSCFSLPSIVTINPPNTKTTVTIKATCQGIPVLQFTPSLTAEFYVTKFAVPLITLKSIIISGIPNQINVGDSFMVTATASATPSATLSLTSSSTCFSVPSSPSIIPPSKFTKFTVQATCESYYYNYNYAEFSFTPSLANEFYVQEIIIPAVVRKSLNATLSGPSTISIGNTMLMKVCLSASPSTTINFIPSANPSGPLSFDQSGGIAVNPGDPLCFQFIVTGEAAGTTMISVGSTLPSEFDDNAIATVVTVLQKQMNATISELSIPVMSTAIVRVKVTDKPSNDFTLTPSDTAAIFSPASLTFSSNSVQETFQITPTSSGLHFISFYSSPYQYEYAPVDVPYYGLLGSVSVTQSAYFLRPSSTVTIVLGKNPSSDLVLALSPSNCFSPSSVTIPTTATTISFSVTKSDPGSAYIYISSSLYEEYQAFPYVYFYNA